MPVIKILIELYTIFKLIIVLRKNPCLYKGKKKGEGHNDTRKANSQVNILFTAHLIVSGAEVISLTRGVTILLGGLLQHHRVGQVISIKVGAIALQLNHTNKDFNSSS